MHRQRLTDVLLQALGIERDGYHFYQLASERSEDPGASETFAGLAEDERIHFDTLQQQYRNVIKGSPWQSEIQWMREAGQDDSAPPFGTRFHDRLQRQHVSMSALSIGILLEKNSYLFYEEQSKQPFPEEVRALFGRLAEWENRHYQALLRQDEALRDDYWQANRFSPLD